MTTEIMELKQRRAALERRRDEARRELQRLRRDFGDERRSLSQWLDRWPEGLLISWIRCKRLAGEPISESERRYLRPRGARRERR